MSPTPPSLETLRDTLLPPPAALEARDGAYNAGHALAVYFEPTDREPTLEYPAFLLGENVAPLTGRGNTVLEGIPETPPEGSIVIGRWETLAARFPERFGETEPPASPEGYRIVLDRFALLAGVERAGCVAGAHLLIQFLAASENGHLPGLELTDAPARPARGFLWRPGAGGPSVERAGHLLGAMSAFRGNRLHLDLTPLGAPESLLESEAIVADWRELANLGREYGVEIVPWLDPAAWTGEGGDAAAALEEVREVFGATLLGIGETPLPAGEHPRFLELLDAVADRVPARTRFALGVARAGSLPHDAVESNRERLFLLSPTFEEAAAWSARGVATGWLFPSGSRGPAPAPPERTAAKLDPLLPHLDAPGGEAALEEVGLAGAAEGDGYSWSLDLGLLAALLATAWRGTGPLGASVRRFGALVFPGEETTYPRMVERLVDAMPGLLYEEEAEEARAFAYGADVDPATWNRLCGLDLRLLEEPLRTATETMQSFLRAHGARSNLLQGPLLSLAAIRFLLTRVALTRTAAEHFRAARDGSAGSRERCARLLEELLQQMEHLRQPLMTARQNGGEYLVESETLNAFRRTLSQSLARLRSWPADQPLPSAESLELPLPPAKA